MKLVAALVLGGIITSSVASPSPVIAARLDASATSAPLNDADAGRLLLRKIAACMVLANESPPLRGALVKFLRLSPNAPSAPEAALALTRSGNCLTKSTQLNVGIHYPPAVLRGQIFRVLYLRKVASPQRPIGWAEEAAQSTFDSADPAFALQQFGDCVVAANPTASDAVIRTEVGSDAERETYAALAPTFSQCISANSTIRFSKAVIEDVLSEAPFKKTVTVSPAATPARTN